MKKFTILFITLCLLAARPILFAQGLIPDEPPPPTPSPPTFANIPEPKHVLVVYKANDVVSIAAKDAYVAARGIPSVNIRFLSIPNSVPYGTDSAFLQQNGEEISGRDSLGWLFYRDRIATPIETYLDTARNSDGDTLKNVIRYIVLCKMVPHKIRSTNSIWYNSPTRKNVAVDAVMCLLHQNVLALYNQPHFDRYSTYWSTDPSFTFSYRFLPHHFTDNSGSWTISYLVSRLDGDNLADVQAAIQRSLQADLSGEKWWVMDDDPCVGVPSTMPLADITLRDRGFTSINPTPYVNSLNWITDNPGGQVMGYTSFGTNAARSPTPSPPCSPGLPRMPGDYILTLLKLTYTSGAIFNSWESTNGWSFGNGRAPGSAQGLLSDFIHRGGSGGECHAYEPHTSISVGREGDMFPAYAMGYTLVDAMYQGIIRIAWQNVVVGDPLVAIALGKQTLTQNKTLAGSNLVTGRVIIPSGKTLTLNQAGLTMRGDSALLDVRGSLVITGSQAASVVGSGRKIIVRAGGRIELLSKATFTINQCELLTESGAMVVVDSGALLVDDGAITANAGTTFLMGRDAQIDVSGTLLAQGTPSSPVQFMSAAGAEWKGITFGRGYGSRLEYATIRDALIGVQSPHDNGLIVTQSEIKHCDIGVHLYTPQWWGLMVTTLTNNAIDSSTTIGIYVDVGASPIIQDNTITNAMTGLYFLGASPLQVLRNHISNCSEYGIYCQQASPSFIDGENGGQNCSVYNNVGFFGYNGSSPVLGLIDRELQPGYNSIADNSSFQVVLLEKCLNVQAYWNFYRPGEPKPSEDFWIDSSSELFWDPYLGDDPNGCDQGTRMLAGGSNGHPGTPRMSGLLDSIANQFLRLRLNHQHTSAIGQLKFLIASRLGDAELIHWAMHELIANFQMLKNPSGNDRLSGYLRGLLQSSINNEVKRTIRDLLASALLHERDGAATLAALDEVVRLHANTPSEPLALYRKVNLGLHVLQDHSIARNALRVLQTKYPTNSLTLASAKLVSIAERGKTGERLGKQGDLPHGTERTEIPLQFSLFQNYPNPFNPSSTIRYGLPHNTLVTLIVYNTLGQQVAQLVNEQQQAGYHDVVFRGDGLASGVYFYRIQAGSFTSVKKLLLLR